MTDTSKKSRSVDTLSDQTRTARCETSVFSMNSMLLDFCTRDTLKLITEMFCLFELHHILHFPLIPTGTLLYIYPTVW